MRGGHCENGGLLYLKRRQQHDETGAAVSCRACRSRLALAKTYDSDGRQWTDAGENLHIPTGHWSRTSALSEYLRMEGEVG